MNPCVGHRCDRCIRCRRGACCLGRRGSRESEVHARVLVTAGGPGPDCRTTDDPADALANCVDSFPGGSLPTVEASLVAARTL